MKRLLAAGAFAALAFAALSAQHHPQDLSDLPDLSDLQNLPDLSNPSDPSDPQGAVAPPQSPRPGSIAPQAGRLIAAVVGQVVDDTGRPVPKAAVRAISHNFVDSVMTDEKGRFLFKDLPAGEFVVTATKSGFHRGGFGQRRAGGDPLPFFLNLGTVISDMRVEIFRSAVITGAVMDDATEPVVGARVIAMRRRFVDGDWRYQVAAADTTDDQGAYRIHGLEPGEYIVSTPTATVTVPATTLAAIGQSGRVSGAMTAFWREAQQVTAGVMPAMIADTADTHVVWNGLREPWTDAGRGLTYPTMFYPASRQPLLALVVNLTPGQVRYAVNFHWAPMPARTIAGRLEGPAGSIADQFMRLVPVDSRESGIEGDSSITISAPDGSFAFRRVPAGRYMLEAGNGVTAAISSVIDLPATDSPEPTTFWGRQDVIVTDDEDLTDLRIEMRLGAALAGVIAIAGNLPAASSTAVPGTTMTTATTSAATSATPATTSPQSTITTPSFPSIPVTLVPARAGLSPIATPRILEDGRFTANNLTPGQYFLRVGALPAGWFLSSITADGEDALDWPIDLGAGEVLDVRIIVSTRGTQLRGLAHDARLRPVSGAAIIVLPARQTTWSPNRTRYTRAHGNGNFSITGLPPGDYLIVAIDDGAAENWQDPGTVATLRALATRVTVKEGEERTVQLRVSPVKR